MTDASDKTLLFGLPKHALSHMRAVFEAFPQIEKVIVYGSRALGTCRPNSDIDITLVGKALDLTLRNRIDEALDDLLLPWQTDLSLFASIEDPDLIDHIHKVGKVLYKRAATTS